MAQILITFEKMAFVIMFISLITVIVLQSPKWYVTLFPGIQRVHIEGNFIHVDRLQIEKIVDQEIAGGFFDIEPTIIEQQLKKIKWIKNAWVYRIWPRTLSIVLEERQPVARWGKDALLDVDAEVFHPKQAYPQALPAIKGAPGREKFLLTTFQKMNAHLAEIGLSIQLFEESERQSLRLVLSNGWMLQLGRQQWDKRLTRFVTVYPIVFNNPAVTLAQEIQCMDFRYSNSFAINKEMAECYQ